VLGSHWHTGFQGSEAGARKAVDLKPVLGSRAVAAGAAPGHHSRVAARSVPSSLLHTTGPPPTLLHRELVLVQELEAAPSTRRGGRTGGGARRRRLRNGEDAQGPVRGGGVCWQG
jgi:hypothetical protein